MTACTVCGKEHENVEVYDRCVECTPDPVEYLMAIELVAMDVCGYGSLKEMLGVDKKELLGKLIGEMFNSHYSYNDEYTEENLIAFLKKQKMRIPFKGSIEYKTI